MDWHLLSTNVFLGGGGGSEDHCESDITGNGIETEKK